MKFRYILIASLLLAVISIGAVAASDDNLAVDGDGVSVDETPVEDVISSDEDGDVVGLVADDFKANVTEEIDLAVENQNIAEVYYPEGAGGNLSLVLTKEDDSTVTFSDVKKLSDYHVGEKITFGIPSGISKGNYAAKLTNVDNNGNVTNIAETSIKVGNYTKDDFNVQYWEDNVDLNEGVLLYLANIPTLGTLLVSVDGEKRYEYQTVTTEYPLYVNTYDLKINKVGKYAVRAVYNTTLGREIELASFDMNVTDGTYWCIVRDTEVYYGSDFNGYTIASFTCSNKKISGLLKFYVNNVEKFSHNIISSDYKIDEDGEGGLMYRAYPGLADLGISKAGNYNIRITLNGKELINSNATVTIRPGVNFPDVMSVGEKQYFTISYSRGSGTAKVYKFIYDDTDYDSMTPFAVFSITNGKGSYSLSELPKGFPTFIVKYNIGDKNYTNVFFLTVKENSAQIKASVTPLKITVGKTVSVTVKGPKKTDKVEIYVDGKLVKSVSLKKGKVNVALSDLAVGSHRVRVMFNDHKDIFFSKTYDVKVKAKPIALSLKKVKVKKSAKKVVIKATLKLKGKLAKGKVVKFKFNKKAYKAKTNKKGVAKVTIKKKVLKKLKRGKKITYSATYKTVTKKVKVKVK